MTLLNDLEYFLIQNQQVRDHNLVILGSSRGVRDFKGFVKPSYIIGIGDLPIRAPKLGPFDLWVTANTQFPQPFNNRHLNLINNSNCRQVLMSTIAWNNSGKIVQKADLFSLQANSKVPIFFFDQRHFLDKGCETESNCCRIFQWLNAKVTLQEFIAKRVPAIRKTYGAGHTVAVHALAIGILMQPEKIFIFGVDLPEYSKDYRYYKRCARIDRTYLGNIKYFYNFLRARTKVPNSSPFGGEVREEMLEDFQILISLANELGVQVYVSGKKSSLLSLKGVLPYVW